MQIIQWILPGNGYRTRLKPVKMSGYRFAIAAAIGLHALVLPALAGGIDGSHPLFGTTHRIIEINPYKIVDNVNPEAIGLPKKFIIDFKARMLRPSKDSVIRKTIQFKRMEHIENSIVLQGIDSGVEGVNDGLAWSITLSKINGSAILAASGDGVAYIVLGTVTPLSSP